MRSSNKSGKRISGGVNNTGSTSRSDLGGPITSAVKSPVVISALQEALWWAWQERTCGREQGARRSVVLWRFAKAKKALAARLKEHGVEVTTSDATFETLSVLAGGRFGALAPECCEAGCPRCRWTGVKQRGGPASPP